MKKILVVLPLLFLIPIASLKAQAVLFSENFESGEIPLNWKQEFVNGAINWRFENGGYSLNPSIPNSRKPIAAHGGNFNALFQFQSLNSEATKLVTKKITALEFAVKPELHFYQAQMDWKHGADYYHDYLRVYYKNGVNSTWKLLREYTSVTTDWVERIIPLPDNDLSADYYLAFEGETHWGYGTCVDDVQIVETGIKTKALASISAEQASDIPISSGTATNPILKLKLKVTGNTGNLPLNAISIQSLNTDDADISPLGVKLYITQDDEFNTLNQIGSGVSFNNGQAVFTGLNYNLPMGYSFLWITYDVSALAGHRNIVDAKLAANSIDINGLKYFSSENSPSGSRTILRMLQSDDFESDQKWILAGEFEYGIPQGLGGSQGNPDPSYAYSGTHIIGTDLNGLGEYPGDYEKNLSKSEYYAISDTFDFTYYNDLSLRYMRYLNIGINDEAFIDVSSDGGKTWKNAWSNTSMILDDTWKLHEVDITALAARKKMVMIRYGLGTTNDYWQLSGWNIDNFAITGNYVSKDAGISRIIAPLDGCGHSSQEEVTVMVKNYGAADSYGIIPLQYSVDGNKTIITDTLKQVIAFGDSVLFTFKKKVDLSREGIYDLRVSTKMAGDDDATNDGLTHSLYVQPTYAENHTESFETEGGLWIPQNLSIPDWEVGFPGFGITPPSGTHVWMTRLATEYPDNDSSFVEGSCYSNSEGLRKIMQLKYWCNTENTFDGAAVQYSTDNGISWQPLDTAMSYWTWYTDSVEVLGTRGWTGVSDGWVTSRIVLPKALTDAPGMKFRMAFGSDESINSTGFAFDDFAVYKAPEDLGVVKIDSFADRCQYINPDRLTIVIKNYGLNPVKRNSPVYVGFDFNHHHAKVDTFLLATDLMPGKTVKHTFSVPVHVEIPGNYNLTAYTLNEADPWFYNGNNDSISVDFNVLPNPITALFDTISTRAPDTVFIRPFYHSTYDYLWNDNSTDRIYDVSHAGWYKVKVTATRGNGCISYDSTFVELLFNDAGIDSLIWPVNSCMLGKEEYLRVRLKNFGTDSIPKGQKIAINYSMDEGDVISDTVLLKNTFYSGHVLNVDFKKGPADLSAKGTYSFTAYSSFSADTVATNDTVRKAVTIYGTPTVSLGTDETVKALSHVLDAGSGFTAYMWDNGSTGQTREIFASGDYWVRVTDENQCYNSDTVNIWLKIRDIRPVELTGPVSSCSFSSGETVLLKMLNSGTDTIPAGGHITAKYALNGSPAQEESITLQQPLLPGQYLSHAFTGTIDMSNPADYHFYMITLTDNDIRTGNDTADLTVYRYPKPVVDFSLPDIVTIQGIETNLDAGYSPYYSYVWQDDFTGSLYHVTRSGNYHVTATDDRTGCFDGDTVTVFLIYNDVGVVSTGLPLQGCSGRYDHVAVRVRNQGTANIGKDVPIYVACDIDGYRVILDTLVRTTNFVTNSNIDLVLTPPLMLTQSSQVAFYTILNSDMKSWNDTLVIPFEALPAPVIDFGDQNGVLNTDLPHILDAGAGQKAYLWQDGSSGQLFTASQSGTYSVTVTGQNDCISEKTVRINPISGLRDDQLEKYVSIYPNPSNGLFFIRLNQPVSPEITLTVYNNQGQEVYQEKSGIIPGSDQILDLQHLPKGAYQLVIQDNEGRHQSQLIIL